MAAFNWVEVRIKCPVCSEATLIRAQVHIAASFDGNSEGRFCNSIYSIGDKMRWWDECDARFNDWMLGSESVFNGAGSATECCYASCSAHNDRLYAIVEVVKLRVHGILELGPEILWPIKYSR